MFEQFLSHGNILSVVLMVYACNVMLEVIRFDRIDPYDSILSSSIAIMFMVAAVPCAIWPAIYIGLYDGWISGIVGWFILQFAGAIMTIVLGMRNYLLIRMHFVFACIAYPIGYYLSYSSL